MPTYINPSPILQDIRAMQNAGILPRSAEIAPGASTAGLPAGTQLINPETGLMYGQANGAGGFSPLGGGAAVLTISAPGGLSVAAVLTATPNTGWTVAGYQWTRNGVDIVGQTSSTYTLVFADETALVGCRAITPTFSALLAIPAGNYPAGQMYLDGLPAYFNASNLSFA